MYDEREPELCTLMFFVGWSLRDAAAAFNRCLQQFKPLWLYLSRVHN